MLCDGADAASHKGHKMPDIRIVPRGRKVVVDEGAGKTVRVGECSGKDQQQGDEPFPALQGQLNPSAGLAFELPIPGFDRCILLEAGNSNIHRAVVVQVADNDKDLGKDTQVGDVVGLSICI